ncbi:GFA family protein [Breoghania sp. L-A4]|nr:GFA family protein [Breoghania sp. L-A4]
MTGRCYCGVTTFHASAPPSFVAYCHCADCRRVTGAPVAAFAAFRCEEVTFAPDEGRVVNTNPGVTRSFCGSCGSPLAGRYDYLPGMVYIGVGLLDQADAYPPARHAHAGEKLAWLHITDDLERDVGSARDHLGPR